MRGTRVKHCDACGFSCVGIPLARVETVRTAVRRELGLVLVVRAGAVDLMRYFVKLYAVRVGLIIFAGIWLRFRDSHWSGLYSLDLVDFLIDKSENGNRFRRPFQNAKCRENGFYISCAEY